jgi:anti-anti-sigma regulatory factor
MEFLEVDNTLHCLFLGKLDGNVCSEIEQPLLKRVSDFKNDRASVRLTFDLANVVYISSAFLRICLICCRTFGTNSFSITNVSDEIHDVFRISGCSEMMNVTRAA